MDGSEGKQQGHGSNVLMSSTEAKQESPDRKPSNDHQSTSKSESKFFSLLIETPPLKLRTADKYTGCNCRKSRCLKMYCICFAKGKMCDKTCLCDSCRNKTDNMLRSEAINEIIVKDPFAFSRTEQEGSLSEFVCNCKKSYCVKKYCECFRRGRKCTAECQCVGCQNKQKDNITEENIKGKKKVKIEIQ